MYAGTHAGLLHAALSNTEAEEHVLGKKQASAATS